MSRVNILTGEMCFIHLQTHHVCKTITWIGFALGPLSPWIKKRITSRSMWKLSLKINGQKIYSTGTIPRKFYLSTFSASPVPQKDQYCTRYVYLPSLPREFHTSMIPTNFATKNLFLIPPPDFLLNYLLLFISIPSYITCSISKYLFCISLPTFRLSLC